MLVATVLYFDWLLYALECLVWGLLGWCFISLGLVLAYCVFVVFVFSYVYCGFAVVVVLRG